MTGPDRPLPAARSAPVTDAQREAVAQALSAHFANDRLTIDTLDARMALVYEATSLVELERALAGLDLTVRPDTDPGLPALIAAPETVPHRSVAMAVLGGFDTKGSWVVPRQLQVVAVLGGGALDMREARFSAGITEINVAAVLGGVEIIVPPGVRVEVLGSAVLGGFALSGVDESAFSPQAPVLRIRGIAVMGGVDVKVRGPTKKMLQRYEAAMQRVRQGFGGRDLSSGR